ncbi:proton-conducting transporter transmembrane domain-containing protein [Pseudonocardia parietis]|uniref:NADH:ubiquinone oxidoreductase subunit 2 (Subunit N) n=1 Tax=Pseudonocardia parietis TaxID=570936 RepID=A0ABS4VS73_9PSEU|nr:proton-conducting transporter membrane subunit [Pseudonocardia parietis]MBP2366766.1 NADH:ubiquinone oxidoreductase subunit 2 (subunit N) [Pseudonocardia parietis]
MTGIADGARALGRVARHPQTGQLHQYYAQASVGFYFAGYAVTNVAAFAVVAATAQRSIDGHRGLARRGPLLAIALVVALLRLVGPPTAVLFGKLAVFTAAVDGGLAWLVALAVLNTVASLFYYRRVIAPAFPPTTTTAPPAPSATSDRGPGRAPWARWAPSGTVAVSLLLGVGAGVVLAVVDTST